jgi:molecular chaperone GrpE
MMNKQKQSKNKPEPQQSDLAKLIQFTVVHKGEQKPPAKKQLERFKVPETELVINEKIINITAKLNGTQADDLALTIAPESIIILSQNKKIAYYTEIRLPKQIIPQATIAKFASGILQLNLSILDSSTPWNGMEQLDRSLQELSETKEKFSKFQKQYHDIQLEYQNLLVKSKKEVEQKIDAYKVSVIDRILKNIDNFELALKSVSNTKNLNHEQILVGINLILNDLKNIILDEGVSEIESKGLSLDPLQHEVIDCEETVKYPENTVIEVYQKGYKYKDRVLRPSKVRVSVAPKTKKKGKTKTKK